MTKNENALMSAVICNDDDDVLHLLREGTSTDLQDHDGNSPLHLAVIMNHANMVTLLTGFGANLKAINKRKLTPMNMALLYENIESAKMLIKAGEDVRERSFLGFTHHTMAILLKREKMVAFLETEDI